MDRACVSGDGGHAASVRMLIAAGADATYRTPVGTARELALRKGHAEIAALLR
jgi:hypothetical protein